MEVVLIEVVATGALLLAHLLFVVRSRFARSER